MGRKMEQDGLKFVVVGCGGVFYHAMTRLGVVVRPGDSMVMLDPDVVERSNESRQWKDNGMKKKGKAWRARNALEELGGFLVHSSQEQVDEEVMMRELAVADAAGVIVVCAPDNNRCRLDVMEGIERFYREADGPLRVERRIVAGVVAGNDAVGGEAYTFVRVPDRWVKDYRDVAVVEDGAQAVSCANQQTARSNGLTACCVGDALEKLVPDVRAYLRGEKAEGDIWCEDVMWGRSMDDKWAGTRAYELWETRRRRRSE